MAIYIRPFCIDGAVVRGDVAPTEAELTVRAAPISVAFASDLKEELSKLAPARILAADEVPRVGWLVEGNFDLIDGGYPMVRFFGHFGAGRSFLVLHVKVTDVVQHRVVYEFYGWREPSRGNSARYARAASAEPPRSTCAMPPSACSSSSPPIPSATARAPRWCCARHC